MLHKEHKEGPALPVNYEGYFVNHCWKFSGVPPVTGVAAIDFRDFHNKKLLAADIPVVLRRAEQIANGALTCMSAARG